MTTLKYIASEAGVSITTVSNVVNENYSKVSSQNIEKIKKLIEKHKYVPNLTARSLNAKSSKIIGVIVPVTDSKYNLFENPYISELFGVIQNTLGEHGYYVMVRSVKDVSDISTLLKNWNMDGAIFLMPDYDNMIYSIMRENELPMVFLDSYLELNKKLSVGINDYKGGYIATRYLINNGHRKIVFAGPCNENNAIMRQRLQGYKDALEKYKLPFDENLVVNKMPSFEEGIGFGREFSNKQYDATAVVTTADIFAIGIMEGARLNGLVIPNDLSIIGFDNLSPCIYVTPKLTTVSQDVENKGKSAVNLLIEYIKNGIVPNNKITLDVEIIERQTVKKISK